MFRGKKYQESAKQIDRAALYDTNEAMELIVKTAPAKFDETVELHVKLGVDSRHADQQVRGAIVLPHGTGKTQRVLVFAKAAKADVDVLIGTDTGKSARTIANEELTKQLIPEGAQESLDTLTEIARWIQDHPDDAAAMNTAIAKLNEIAAGIGGEEDDYATVMAAIEGKITAAMAGIAQGATKVEKSDVNGNIKINGQETVVYTHPAGSAVEAGFKKVGSDANGHVVMGGDVTKEDITKLGIPAQDTTYEKATAEKDGLMSKEDKKKLDDMAVAENTEVQSMLDEVFGATEEEP